MTLYLVPELGPAIPSRASTVLDLPVRAASATRTIDLLVKHGLEVKFDPNDCEIAGKEVIAYAENPAEASKALTDKRMEHMTPAALRAIDTQLKTFSHNIVENAQQVRTFVTNKLLEETDNPDPRIRIKALELLGKIGDVGLFADKTEVTVTHQTTSDLREALREKLTRLTNPDLVLDAEVIESEPLSPETLSAAWDE